MVNTRQQTHVYKSAEQKLDTLFRLVNIESVTESEGEIAIAHELERMIRELPYYEDHPEHLVLHEVGNYRKVVAALAKAPTPTRKTAIVIAHFDVVAADEFGVYAPYAFQPQTWTEMIYKEEVPLPDYVRDEISDGNWVFGRGVMDMKCGIVLNLSLLEQACNGEFDGNVLFLGVPDEERHSDGMIGAGPLLLEWKKQFDLEYSICIDTEPAFAEHEEDGALIYSGTIGKLLVGSYAIGRETHVGSPFEGLSGVRMIAELTRTLELNPDLVEWVGPDHTPPIACLQNRDLKMHYSVQTPYKAGGYYNVFFLQRSPSEALTKVKEQAEQSMADLSSWYQGRIESAGLSLTNWADETSVMTLAELLQYVRDTEPELIDRGLEMMSISHGTDLRETTMTFVDHVASAVPELHPLVVLFFAPPFYPAISSAENPLVQQVMDKVTQEAKERHDVSLLRRNYFPGLCDLSYVGLGSAARDAKDLEQNMPVLGSGYNLPLDVLRQLEIPVLNIGPYGRDPHKWTERLELQYSFGVTPNLLTTALHEVFRTGREQQEA